MKKRITMENIMLSDSIELLTFLLNSFQLKITSILIVTIPRCFHLFAFLMNLKEIEKLQEKIKNDKYSIKIIKE